MENAMSVKNEAAVMFSGGIDSLLGAVLLKQTYDRVHLITFDKGYLEFGIRNNQPNVQRLKDTFGEDHFTHQIVDIKKLVKTVSVRSLRRDRKTYNMEICWCVGCRMSMNAGALIFALENGLAGYADGSNREQIPGPDSPAGTAENFPSIVNRHKDFARSYNVDFLTPVWNFGSREERREKLRELGFDIDYLSLDHSKKVKGLMTKDVFQRSQPLCLSGWLIHWKRNLLGKPVEQDEKMTLDYIIGKQEGIVREYIRNHFAEKGQDIEAVVRARASSRISPVAYVRA
ncbi:MAG: 7-cyano-7-deazaguanine synthase [Candidatus Aminicenantes bacterium]|nr:7-cyano-7-deazaguanine synthase [Candidatus Aminicenantes bacterium]